MEAKEFEPSTFALRTSLRLSPRLVNYYTIAVYELQVLYVFYRFSPLFGWERGVHRAGDAPEYAVGAVYTALGVMGTCRSEYRTELVKRACRLRKGYRRPNRRVDR